MRRLGGVRTALPRAVFPENSSGSPSQNAGKTAFGNAVRTPPRLGAVHKNAIAISATSPRRRDVPVYGKDKIVFPPGEVLRGVSAEVLRQLSNKAKHDCETQNFQNVVDAAKKRLKRGTLEKLA